MSGPRGRRNGMWKRGYKIAGDRNGMRTHPGAIAGERNGNAKLTAKRARYIREIFPLIGIQRLARMYKVDPRTIRRVINGEGWLYV